MDILSRAKELNEEIVSHRRQFHQNPELGHVLPMTKAYIIEKLTEMGYEPKEYGQSGVVVLAGGKKPGKTFLIRADVDALPIREETGLPFASENGCMHACGHDCHGAMMLGAAKILKEMEEELEGTIKILFQPAEEPLTGAQEMVDAGVLEDPKVDAALMLHIASGMPIPTGCVAVFAGGPCYSSADWYRIDVEGKGGHGATPEAAISPIDILNAIYSGMQSIMSLGIPASTQASMTVGEIHSGDTSNIIPATGFMAGTIRTYDEEVRATIKEKLTALAEGVAQAKGGKAVVSFPTSIPAVSCDQKVRTEVLESLREGLGSERVLDLATLFGGKFSRINGSEDFSCISVKVPSAVLTLAAGTPQEGYTYPAHNPRTNFNEDVLYMGTAAYVTAAVDWLKKNK